MTNPGKMNNAGRWKSSLKKDVGLPDGIENPSQSWRESYLVVYCLTLAP